MSTWPGRRLRPLHEVPEDAKPVDWIACMIELKAKLRDGTITRKEFEEMREPVKRAIEKQLFSD